MHDRPNSERRPPSDQPPTQRLPGYPPYAAYFPPDRPMSVMAIVGLVFAFSLPPLGILLGVAARKRIRAGKEDGDTIALLAIFIGSLFTVMGLASLLMVTLLLAVTPWHGH